MKFKYFLRGLGAGIVFASLIFFMVYKENGTAKMSDKQIIERAKELGMVEEKSAIEDILHTSATSEDPKNKETASTTEKTTKEEKRTTEATTEQTTEAATESTTETKEKVSITVERGATSYTVCQKLQELGIIEDAAEYDNYLIENGYASRIRVGTHELTKGMDYHAIAEAISDPL